MNDASRAPGWSPFDALFASGVPLPGSAQTFGDRTAPAAAAAVPTPGQAATPAAVPAPGGQPQKRRPVTEFVSQVLGTSRFAGGVPVPQPRPTMMGGGGDDRFDLATADVKPAAGEAGPSGLES